MSNWMPFNGCFGDNEYFLIRQKGNHPATGKKLVPVVAQQISEQLCDVDGQAIVWSVPAFLDIIEWMPIPE